MFCYIKDGELVTTSPQLIEKRKEEVTGEVTKTRSVEKEIDGEMKTVDEEYTETVVVFPFVDWMVYNEVIETTIEGRVCYENGKIIVWDKSKEKTYEDQQETERQTEWIKTRSSQIVSDLGRLKIEKDGLELLGQDTTEVDTKIQSLKDEYATL